MPNLFHSEFHHACAHSFCISTSFRSLRKSNKNGKGFQNWWSLLGVNPFQKIPFHSWIFSITWIKNLGASRSKNLTRHLKPPHCDNFWFQTINKLSSCFLSSLKIKQMIHSLNDLNNRQFGECQDYTIASNEPKYLNFSKLSLMS